MAMQDRRLTISAKATYAYFCSFTGAGDTCFPTRKKICYDLNISNDTLSKQLRLLVDCGYITIEQIKENGRFSHNVYTLTDTILPCPKISDTENSEYGELDTKNNNSKNNNLLKNNRTKERDESPKRTRFVPPTLDEVKAYCVERNNTVDAERFINYYSANGWKVGRNSMRDWKATVRNWEKNGYDKGKKTYGQNGIAIDQDATDEFAGLF